MKRLIFAILCICLLAAASVASAQEAAGYKVTYLGNNCLAYVPTDEKEYRAGETVFVMFDPVTYMNGLIFYDLHHTVLRPFCTGTASASSRPASVGTSALGTAAVGTAAAALGSAGRSVVSPVFWWARASLMRDILSIVWIKIIKRYGFSHTVFICQQATSISHGYMSFR